MIKINEYLKKNKPTVRELLCCYSCGGILSVFELIGQIMSDEISMLHLGSVMIQFFMVAILAGSGLCLFYKILDCIEFTGKTIEDKKLKVPSMMRIFVVVLLCWLPYCLLSYPARFGGGSQFQINQFLGMETNARLYSSVIYDGHYITNHHPVLLTYFYGLFYEIGEWIGNVNLGMFLLSIVILIISSLSMAYALINICRHVSEKVFRFILIFVCVYPIFGVYSYTICKDNLYASALLVFSTCLLQIYFSKGRCLASKKFALGFMGICIIIPFLKHQGGIMIFVSLLTISVVAGQFWKKILLNAGIVFVVYSILFTNILMPAMKIAPGGRQEALSIPFQQTAYYVKHYGQELTEQEYAVINEILPVDEIGYLYEEGRADEVKFTFKQDATSSEMSAYFQVWFRQFLKHPVGYMKAFLKMNYGYYYLGFKDCLFDLYRSVDVGEIETPDWAIDLFLSADQLWKTMCNLKGIGILFRVAVMTWMMFITLFYCIYKKKFKFMAVLIPLILSFAVCLLCPWNGVYRYGLPIIYSFPIMSCILFGKHEKDNVCMM